MSADVTQILSENSNIVFKSAAGDILKIMPSQNTFAHPSAAPNSNIIQFNNSPDRLPSNESFFIKVDQITTPAGPWTQQTLLEELKNNYINTAITVEGLDNLATEATLREIRLQTDLLTFTGSDLNVTGAGGGGSAAEVTAFVTTALLASGATFDSGPLDANGKTQVQTEVNASHDGTINIYFCSDAAGLDVVRSLSIPYIAANGYQFFAAPAFVNYIKYEFTNNAGVTQTDFYYTTKFLTTGLSPQLLTTNAFIAPAMVANLGRNIIVGQNTAGNFNNVPLDSQSHLEVNVSNPKTAYDELAVANLSPVSQITFPYNVNTDIVNVTETASGTVTQANNMAVLNTGATTGSAAIITSIEQVPFRAGLGHIARFSCLFSGTPTVATAYIGIGVGDALDGYGFLLNNLGFNISYRTNGTPTNTLQTSWNIDKMDGTKGSSNPSGMLLDTSKGNSYQIAYGSGFGAVNFSIESATPGDYVLVHVLTLGNTLTTPSVYNPTFPMRAEAANGTGTDDLTMYVASLASFVEGKNAIKYSQGVLNSKGFSITKAWTTTEEHIATWRNNANVFGGTANNKVYCKIKAISFNNDTTKSATIRIYENITITGSPVYTDINSNTSVISTDTAGGITAGTEG